MNQVRFSLSLGWAPGSNAAPQANGSGSHTGHGGSCLLERPRCIHTALEVERCVHGALTLLPPHPSS